MSNRHHYAREDPFHPGTYCVLNNNNQHCEQFFDTLEEAQQAALEWDEEFPELDPNETWLDPETFEEPSEPREVHKLVESLVVAEVVEEPLKQLKDPNDDDKKKATAMVQNAPRTGAVEIHGDKAKAEALAADYRAMVVPRDLALCDEFVLEFCNDPAFAERAVTARPDHADKKGPSIRLMEVIACGYGNIKYGDSTLNYDRLTQTEVRIHCRDLQRNSSFEKDYTIAHERQTGSKRNGNFKVERIDEPQAIEDHVNAKIALLTRKALQKIIPSPLVRKYVDHCEKVLAENLKDIAAKKLKLYTALKENYGIKSIDIQRYFKTPVDQLSREQFVELWRIYVALNNNEAEATDWFPDLNLNQIEKPKEIFTDEHLKVAADAKEKNEKEAAKTKGGKPVKAETPAAASDSKSSPTPNGGPTTTPDAAPPAEAKKADPKQESSNTSQAAEPSVTDGAAPQDTGSTPAQEKQSQQPAPPASNELDSIWG